MATTQEIMDKLLSMSACGACSDAQEKQNDEELDLYDSPPTADHDWYPEEDEEDDYEDAYEDEATTYAGDDYSWYFGGDIDGRYSLLDAVDRIQGYLSDIEADLSEYKYHDDVLDGIGSNLECIWKQVIDLECTTDNNWEYEQ